MLQLRYFSRIGLFCSSCAQSLIKEDLAVEMKEKERRHGEGVAIQGHATPTANRDGMSGVSRV